MKNGEFDDVDWRYISNPFLLSVKSVLDSYRYEDRKGLQDYYKCFGVHRRGFKDGNALEFQSDYGNVSMWIPDDYVWGSMDDDPFRNQIVDSSVKHHLVDLLQMFRVTGYIAPELLFHCVYISRDFKDVARYGRVDKASGLMSLEEYYLWQDDWKTVYLRARFPEIDPIGFYQDVFQEGYLQEEGKENYHDGKTCGIAIELINEGEQKTVKRYSVTEGLAPIYDLIERGNFVLMSPISYVGKARKSSNARYMFALTIDLDGIERLGNINELVASFYPYEKTDRHGKVRQYKARLPLPTYIVNSGTGLHLYYVFEKPIRLYASSIRKLQQFKEELTKRVWSRNISTKWDAVQNQSIFQGFRLVGGVTKAGKRTVAFRSGDKVTLDYLNQFVPARFRVNLAYNSTLSIQEAKKKYPDWYQKRIVERSPKEHWVCNEALYDWWLNRIKEERSVGHRYYCIMCLAIYAKKSGIDRKRLEDDAFSLVPEFDSITENPDNHFKDEDVVAALQAYDDDYFTYPINSIEKVSGIHIEKNLRRGRKREQHLRRCRALAEVDAPDWNKKGNGRKPKLDVIVAYLKENPEARKVDVIHGTGLSKPTVYKWWEQAHELLEEEAG